MINIAVLEDNKIKVERIDKLIREFQSQNNIEVNWFSNIISAKQGMIKKNFHLFITDINLPLQEGGENIEDGGINLLIEIQHDDRIIKPNDVIILSEYDNLLKKLEEHLDISHFYHIHFDINDIIWEDSIRSKIKYIIDLNEKKDVFDYDFAFITALKIEDDELEKQFKDWEIVNFIDDPTIYKTTFLNESKKIKIVKAKQNEMGMTASAVLSAKLISIFKPKYLIMVGIAAGIAPNLNLGDILFASEVWNYSSGKFVDEDNENGYILLPDPKHLPISPEICELASLDYRKSLAEIQNRSDYNKNVLKMIHGPIACGPAVVATKKIIDEMILKHSRKTIGLDMESYGICYSAMNMRGIKPHTIIIKSVCDFANKNKDDSAHKYAAYTSSSFAKCIIDLLVKN